MVKSWANDFVELYETEFSHKIDWDEVKKTGGWIWKTEERDGWRYEYGGNYFPIENNWDTELYEVQLKKTNIGFVKTKKEYKRYCMWGVKGDTRPSKPNIKKGEWVYNSFHT